MCGRFTLYTPKSELERFFEFTAAAQLISAYNICPSQEVLAVRPGEGGREGVLLKWGLVPGWAKESAIGNKLTNARSETVHEKPSFRNALKKRRCMVLADGFYEWRKEPGGGKTPVFIHRVDGKPFAIAGLYEHWEREGSAIDSCTLLTTAANARIAPVHDRMPVILAPADYTLWLDPAVTDAEALRHLFVPIDSAVLDFHPVGRAVNSPRSQGDGLILPAAAEGQANPS